MSAIQVQLFLQLFHPLAVQFHSRWMALCTTVVRMMGEASDVSMATETGNCVSSRQVEEKIKHLHCCSNFGIFSCSWTFESCSCFSLFWSVLMLVIKDESISMLIHYRKSGITLQISKRHTRRHPLLLWAPTQLSPCRYWLSTVGSWCRGRSLEVRWRSSRTGRNIVTGLDQRQATTTTGWDWTRSTVSCSGAVSDSGLRYWNLNFRKAAILVSYKT